MTLAHPLRYRLDMEPTAEVKLHRILREWELSLLAAGDLYLVGGTVRDLLLGFPENTVDEDYLVRGIPLDELTGLLRPFGETNLVGKSFGVIKFTTFGGPTVDLSLPRREFSTGPGHRDFSVSFDPALPVEEDLVRRDFTINSMAAHLRTGRITDPLGGRHDLAERLLRVNRSGSFVEDPLRILRGVQIASRFDLRIDGETRRLMEREAHLIGSISPERIRDELSKLLTLADRPGNGFVLMHEIGILAAILPELDATWKEEQNEYHPDDLFMHSVKSCDLAPRALPLRWAALLHDIGKKRMKKTVAGRVVFYRHEEESARLASEILERLRYPGELIERVSNLIAHHMFNITEEWSDAAMRRFISRVGVDSIEDLLAVREADARSRGESGVMENVAMIRSRVAEIRSADAAFSVSDLAIGGRDVMETLGIGEGPAVGEALELLLEAVLEDPGLNTREKLVERLKGMKR